MPTAAPPPASTPQVNGVQGIPGTDGTALVGGASNRCVDIDKNTYTNGTQAHIWDCTNGTNQKRTLT